MEGGRAVEGGRGQRVRGQGAGSQCRAAKGHEVTRSRGHGVTGSRGHAATGSPREEELPELSAGGVLSPLTPGGAEDDGHSEGGDNLEDEDLSSIQEMIRMELEEGSDTD